MYSLYEREAVPDTGLGSAEECHHVPPYPGNGRDGIGETLPSLRPAHCIISNEGMCAATRRGSYRGRMKDGLKFHGIFSPQMYGSVNRHNRYQHNLAFPHPINKRARGGGVSQCLTVQKLTGWTHTIASWLFPFLSVYGLLRGTTSSLSATRIVAGTGACRRRVSRTTASRYGRSFSSSMVGLSVDTAITSVLSLSCTSLLWVSANSAHVVATLMVTVNKRPGKLVMGRACSPRCLVSRDQERRNFCAGDNPVHGFGHLNISWGKLLTSEHILIAQPLVLRQIVHCIRPHQDGQNVTLMLSSFLPLGTLQSILTLR